MYKSETDEYDDLIWRVNVCQLGSYDKQRVSSLHDAICEFAEAKIKTAQDTYTSLQLSLDYVKQLGEL